MLAEDAGVPVPGRGCEVGLGRQPIVGPLANGQAGPTRIYEGAALLAGFDIDQETVSVNLAGKRLRLLRAIWGAESGIPSGPAVPDAFLDAGHQPALTFPAVVGGRKPRSRASFTYLAAVE
jgi:hypothetical protein